MYGFVGVFLLKRAAGDCMVRVHCPKDTLDAHARPGVATRSKGDKRKRKDSRQRRPSKDSRKKDKKYKKNDKSRRKARR